MLTPSKGNGMVCVCACVCTRARAGACVHCVLSPALGTCYAMQTPSALLRLCRALWNNHICLLRLLCNPVTSHDSQELFHFHVTAVLKTCLCPCQLQNRLCPFFFLLWCLGMLFISTSSWVFFSSPQTGDFFGEVEGAVMNKLLTMGSFKR